MLDTHTGKTTGSQLRFDYIPRPGLLGIALTNLALNLITLTFYRFWARTDVRRHIWSCVHINGEALEYTGLGKELFIGALTQERIDAIKPLDGPSRPVLTLEDWAALRKICG